MTPYEQGFIEKCAEYGVDAETLLKQAGLLSTLKSLLGKGKGLPLGRGAKPKHVSSVTPGAKGKGLSLGRGDKPKHVSSLDKK